MAAARYHTPPSFKHTPISISQFHIQITMDHNFAAFTVFTFLLFAGSTAARISFDPSATADLPVVQTINDASNTNIKSLKETQPAAATGDSNIVLPTEILKSESDVTDHELETEKTRMFRVDLTPRSDFARFHAINRHFFDEPRVPLRSVHRRPYRQFINPFAIPRSEISHGDEVILSVETGNVDAKAFHRRVPSKRMKVKHDYGHRHHSHHHHHLHLHHANNDGSVPKHVFDREKVKSMVRQHEEEKREHEAGFMKRIRKFLKHTFD